MDSWRVCWPRGSGEGEGRGPDKRSDNRLVFVHIFKKLDVTFSVNSYVPLAKGTWSFLPLLLMRVYELPPAPPPVWIHVIKILLFCLESEFFFFFFYSCIKLSLLLLIEESIDTLAELSILSILQKQLDVILEYGCWLFFFLKKRIRVWPYMHSGGKLFLKRAFYSD